MLLEALVSFTLLAVGLLTLARWEVTLRADADTAAHRSDAVRLAQTDLETMRADTGAPVTATRTALAADATALRLARRVDPAAPGDARGTEIEVAWADRSGRSQQVRLGSMLTGADPALGGALSLAGALASRPQSGPHARAASIPVGASDLGDGRSAWRPVVGDPLAFVFDNASGRVAQRCEQTDATQASATLSAATLGRCESFAGLSLSGTVRFALSDAPDPDQANDPPLPFTLALRLVGGPYPVAPSCGVQRLKGVAWRSGSIERVEQVALDALPASVGAATWAETGERYGRYFCAVGLRADGRWSGRLDFAPIGWTIGSGSGARRLCRYVADLDRSGAIDANREHPSAYVAVDEALPHQNWLVVRGDRLCPAPATQPR